MTAELNFSENLEVIIEIIYETDTTLKGAKCDPINVSINARRSSLRAMYGVEIAESTLSFKDRGLDIQEATDFLTRHFAEYENKLNIKQIEKG